MVERAVWLLCKLNDGQLLLEANFRRECAMHESRWPGYPRGWVDLWKGPLWRRLKQHDPDLQVSRLLMRAGGQYIGLIHRDVSLCNLPYDFANCARRWSHRCSCNCADFTLSWLMSS